MQCYKCGKDIGDKLGLCSDCLHSRTERETVSRDVSLIPSPQSGNKTRQGFLAGLSLQAGLACAAVLLATFLFWRHSRVPDFVTSADGEQFRLMYEDGNELNYKLSKSVKMSARAIFFDDMKAKLDGLGAAAVVHYLSETDYQEYLKNVRGKQCPAGFFNQRMKHLLLVPRSREQAIEIAKMRFQEGEHFSLVGNRLQLLGGKQKGYPFQMSADASSEFLVLSSNIL
jgi:hypothetical protein